MRSLTKIVHLLGIAAVAVLTTAGAQAQTLKGIKDRGMLNCGVSQGLYGFSLADDKGNWSGLDVDFCRALAAAIFNDASKVKFFPLSTGWRMIAGCPPASRWWESHALRCPTMTSANMNSTSCFANTAPPSAWDARCLTN